MYCMSPHAAVKYKKTSERSRTAHWCCTAQMELFCSKTQCQTILLHTSFKLRFNGPIITSPPMKLQQFQLNPFARSIYLRSHVIMWGFEWHSNSQGPGVPSEFVFGRQAEGGDRFRWASQGGPVTWSRSLSSPMTAAVFQSMISEKGSSQPLLSITGTHAAWGGEREGGGRLKHGVTDWLLIDRDH